jgi:hypothetical protein
MICHARDVCGYRVVGQSYGLASPCGGRYRGMRDRHVRCCDEQA